MDINDLISYSKNGIYWNSGGNTPEAEKPNLAEADGKVIYNAIPANVKLEDNKVKVVGAKATELHNAKYIQFQDQMATLAKADDNVKILVSSGFSGCIFQLWKAKDGSIVGAHVYKGTDMSADMTGPAVKAGWRLLYTWDSKGVITKLGQEGFVVVEVGDKRIETVVLLTEKGKTTALIDWHTTEDWK